ncbi:MAG: nickel pincer cofactor biosynthesis protein LarB [Bacteroidales bacterium]|nr:nickel pincer cofactor biosynthesis protein LarB [Clostridium sp.]MCM1204891.1 nickel pincer cofactor biosynthesis protein LarB [Bacteroidales bacterium]
MTIEEILERVSTGELMVEEAGKQIMIWQKEGQKAAEAGNGAAKKQAGFDGYQELGYAKLDIARKYRTGFAEVVYCSGKNKEQLRHIYERIYREEGEVLGTRATEEQYEALKPYFQDITFDSCSKILKIQKADKQYIGKVAVCTAGTADIPVAEEAAQTAEFFGTKVERIYDVGVSGIHRLLSKVEDIQCANCVVAVAGMEGALASVIGGLVSNPVIAVPTSVGYGAGLNGLSALLTMVNSCANGIAVVNIDNGYGAGYMATQINRLAVGDKG